MFRNYLKVAWRNLIRHISFTIVNVTGLALGITCCIVMLLWVGDELRYDGFHTKGKQLYWVLANRYSETVETTDATPEPLAVALKSEISGIEEVTQFVQFVDEDMQSLFIVGQQRLKEKEGIFVSASFFSVFSFPLLKGNSKTALASPNAIVISQTLAKKYFGELDPIGKIIEIQDRGGFIVTGVMEDIPTRSSIKANFVLPLSVYLDEYKWLLSWESFGINTVVQLNANVTPASVSERIEHLLGKKTLNEKATLLLQPFSEKYLHTIKAGQPSGGRIEYVRLFAFAAVFVLVIACVNFMNLSTAQASKRGKEVGVRKVIGAERSALIVQFVSEAFLITILAFIVGLALTYCLLPTFSSLTGKTLMLEYSNPYFIGLLIGMVILTAIIAGGYPALFLASLEPNKVLKGSLKFGNNAILFRKGLVVFQFLMSALLIISAIIVQKQVNFIKTENLGLDRHNLLYVNVEGDLFKNRELFKQDLLKSSAIHSLTTSARMPINNEGSAKGLEWPGMQPGKSIFVAPLSVGYDFIKTMNIELKEGRDFSKDFATDSVAYIVNESAIQAMGMQEPLGKDISFRLGMGKIIGIIKDFHLQSLHVPIRPLVMMLIPKNANHIFIRTQDGKIAEALEKIEKTFLKYNPNFPFEYHFLEDQFEQQYKSENLVGQLSSWFAFVATAISCLGLFGLALFSVEVRRKEIGVRKILGASAFNIILLLSKDFLKLVLIANLIAVPVAWWALNHWLQSFAYRTNVSWWAFILTTAISLVVSLFTVGFQSIKAAQSPPVKALRAE